MLDPSSTVWLVIESVASPVVVDVLTDSDLEVVPSAVCSKVDVEEDIEASVVFTESVISAEVCSVDVELLDVEAFDTSSLDDTEVCEVAVGFALLDKPGSVEVELPVLETSDVVAVF